MLEQLRKNKKVWIAIVAITVLVIGIIIAAVALHNNSENSKAPDQKTEKAEDSDKKTSQKTEKAEDSDKGSDEEPEEEYTGEGLRAFEEYKDEDAYDASGSWDETDDSNDKKNNGSSSNSNGGSNNGSNAGSNNETPSNGDNSGQGNEDQDNGSDVSEEGTLSDGEYGPPI